ncbi:helix-turn-helix transcriptional regulator [Agrobacterium tumefaciens]|uniref:Autoinducer binding domain n=2 Tax=Agrobacterium tumefaciens TaxID=358 RepID=A0A1S6WDT4_AGRTU|nr:autoinducer binding domain [Agrobacterium radiobacter]
MRRWPGTEKEISKLKDVSAFARTGIARCERGCGVTYLGEALAELAKVDTLPALGQYIGNLREAVGLANMAFHVVNAPRTVEMDPLVLVTYERQWVRQYMDQDYVRIDPIVVQGASSFLPLDWDDVDRSSTRMRELFTEAESYGVGRRGLTLPVRGPGGEKSLLTITTYESEREWAKRRLSLLRDMHVVAHFIHDRCLSVSGLRTNSARPRLSRRELQCMRALALGLAPKQIAFELKISISAVRLYIRSAKSKLGAANTNQAIATAVQDEHVVV